MVWEIEPKQVRRVRLLREKVASRPNDVESQKELGFALYETGQYEAACKQLQKCIDKDIQHPLIPLRLARAHLAQWSFQDGNHERLRLALDAFKIALQHSENYRKPTVFMEVAAISVHTQEFNDALTILTSVATRYPDTDWAVLATYLSAHVSFVQGDLEQCVEIYTELLSQPRLIAPKFGQAVTIFPTTVSNYLVQLELARTYERLGWRDLAMATYRELHGRLRISSAEYNSKYPRFQGWISDYLVWKQFGMAYLREHNFIFAADMLGTAAEKMDKTLWQGPGAPQRTEMVDILLKRADCMQQIGMTEMSEHAALLAQHVDPDDAVVLCRAAQYLETSDKNKETLERAQHAMYCGIMLQCRVRAFLARKRREKMIKKGDYASKLQAMVRGWLVWSRFAPDRVGRGGVLRLDRYVRHFKTAGKTGRQGVEAWRGLYISSAPRVVKCMRQYYSRTRFLRWRNGMRGFQRYFRGFLVRQRVRYTIIALVKEQIEIQAMQSGAKLPKGFQCLFAGDTSAAEAAAAAPAGSGTDASASVDGVDDVTTAVVAASNDNDDKGTDVKEQEGDENEKQQEGAEGKQRDKASPPANVLRDSAHPAAVNDDDADGSFEACMQIDLSKVCILGKLWMGRDLYSWLQRRREADRVQERKIKRAVARANAELERKQPAEAATQAKNSSPGYDSDSELGSELGDELPTTLRETAFNTGGVGGDTEGKAVDDGGATAETKGDERRTAERPTTAEQQPELDPLQQEHELSLNDAIEATSVSDSLHVDPANFPLTCCVQCVMGTDGVGNQVPINGQESPFFHKRSPKKKRKANLFGLPDPPENDPGALQQTNGVEIAQREDGGTVRTLSAPEPPKRPPQIVNVLLQSAKVLKAAERAGIYTNTYGEDMEESFRLSQLVDAEERKRLEDAGGMDNDGQASLADGDADHMSSNDEGGDEDGRTINTRESSRMRGSPKSPLADFDFVSDKELLLADLGSPSSRQSGRHGSRAASGGESANPHFGGLEDRAVGELPREEQLDGGSDWVLRTPRLGPEPVKDLTATIRTDGATETMTSFDVHAITWRGLRRWVPMGLLTDEIVIGNLGSDVLSISSPSLHGHDVLRLVRLHRTLDPPLQARLTSIFVYGCPIHDSGVIALAELLGGNVHTFAVGNVGMGRKGMRAIVERFASKTCRVQKLFVENEPNIGDRGVDLLFKLIQRKHCVRMLTLRNIGLTDRVATTCNIAISLSRTLQVVNLNGNDFSYDGIMSLMRGVANKGAYSQLEAVWVRDQLHPPDTQDLRDMSAHAAHMRVNIACAQAPFPRDFVDAFTGKPRERDRDKWRAAALDNVEKDESKIPLAARFYV